MKRRRNFGRCSHSVTITTITAGLAREVCENCAMVRISYVERAVETRPIHVVEREGPEIDLELEQAIGEVLAFEEEARYLKCRLCSQPAVFMIPEGLSCDEHAWQAAARLAWDETDPWVPIRIDRSNA